MRKRLRQDCCQCRRWPGAKSTSIRPFRPTRKNRADKPALIVHSGPGRSTIPPFRIAGKAQPDPRLAGGFLHVAGRNCPANAGPRGHLLERGAIKLANSAADGKRPQANLKPNGITISAAPACIRHPAPESLVVRIRRVMLAYE